MAYRKRALTAIARLKTLCYGQFFKDYFTDGNYIKRRCRGVDSDDPKGPFHTKTGVMSTDSLLDGLTFEALVDRDVFNRDGGTIPVRTIEGVTGSGKTLLMYCLHEEINERIQSDPANRVVCTEPINCNGVNESLGNYLRGFVWKVVDAINRSYRNSFQEDYQRFQEAQKGPLERPLKLIEGYYRNGELPQATEQGLFVFDLIVEFAVRLSKRGYRCVVLLDELTHFCEDMLNSNERGEFLAKCFNYLIDESMARGADLLMVYSIVEDCVEAWLKTPNRAFGAFRRIEDRRVNLGAFELSERKDLIRKLLEDYYFELVPSKLDGKIDEYAEKWAKAVKSGSASAITKEVVKGLNEELQIDNDKILKDWEKYQHKAEPVFLEKAKELYRQHTGEDANSVKIGSVESEYKKSGHPFDHYVRIPYYNGDYHFFGETSKTNLTPKKYNQGFRQLVDLIPNLGDRQFLILISPKCTAQGEARAKDHDVVFVDVPSDATDTVPGQRSGPIPGREQDLAVPPSNIDKVIERIPKGTTPGGKPRRIGFDKLFELAREDQADLDRQKMEEALRNCDRLECTDRMVGRKPRP
ncbi:MAG: hypothetical protein V1792_01450 [Pseudomonadota bacterium]